MARPRLHDENMRTRLLEHAGRLVTEHGVEALSLRALAADAETSTTAVYSLFGGKSELLGALYAESFGSFGASQRAVRPTGDVPVDLAALGRAYWQWATLHPHLYGVMFGAVLTGFEPSPDQLVASRSTMEPLAAVVRSGVQQGALFGDEFAITFAIWAAVHGVVSLVLAGCAPDDESLKEQLFTAAASAAVRGWSTRPTP